jgi:hypothetical protein
MGDSERPPAPRRVGFFTMTPGRWLFLSAAGTAALAFAGLVVNAWEKREEVQKKVNAPVGEPAPSPPPPPLPAPPPAPDPAVVLREAGKGLESAQAHTDTIRQAAPTSTHPLVLEQRKKAAAATERLIVTAETALRALDGRPLSPEQAAERDRLTARVTEVRRALRAAAAPTGATGKR